MAEISAEYSARGAGHSSNTSNNATTAPISRRRCGQRSPIAANAPAISTATPSTATIENRPGMRASPNPGAYRSSAHGPGTCVLMPAM